MLARLFVLLQYLLPRLWLTAIVYRVARIRKPAVKDFLIARFIKLYDIDTDDVKHKIPGDFPTFNDFFIRELEEDARPVDHDPAVIVAPVDGTVSQAGRIEARSILQAKRFHYSLDELLATDLQDADAFVDGSFATIYLAPFNYHRVHSPFDGEITAAHYVPGDLFSVNEATVANIGGLFRRNERVVLRFQTAFGPSAVLLVGALNVGSISTPWSGEVRPRKAGVVDTISLEDGPHAIRKGDLLGWFNMGSTVIVLLPQSVCRWRESLIPGRATTMGEAIGDLSEPGS